MDTQRLILFFIFSFSLLLLWDAWEKQGRPKPVPAPAAQTVPAVPIPVKPAAPSAAGITQPASVPAAAPTAKGETLRVQTDLLVAEIDTLGATLSKVELLKHKHADDPGRNLVLLGPAHHYFAQSGLAGEGGPNHRTPWKAQRACASSRRRRQAGGSPSSAQGAGGVAVEQGFRLFARDSTSSRSSWGSAIKGAVPLSPMPTSSYARRQVRVRAAVPSRNPWRSKANRIRRSTRREEVPEDLSPTRQGKSPSTCGVRGRAGSHSCSITS